MIITLTEREIDEYEHEVRDHINTLAVRLARKFFDKGICTKEEALEIFNSAQGSLGFPYLMKGRSRFYETLNALTTQINKR